MFTLADTSFQSRLFTGTGKFASAQQMLTAIVASGSELVTLMMRRLDLSSDNNTLKSELR